VYAIIADSPAEYPSGPRGRIANPLFVGSNPTSAFRNPPRFPRGVCDPTMPRLPDEIPDSSLRLLIAPGIGPATFRKLMERFDGDHESAADASIPELRTLPGVGPKAADTIRKGLDTCDVAAERTAMREAHASMILLGDQDYPPLLASIADPPPALWLRGELRPEDQVAVAIVGSRECTVYGREQAGRFAAVLAQAGLAIVSGGARGIDGEAHRAALRVNGRTVAVLGCGLSEIYPPEHAELFQSIVASGGAILSEQPMRMKAQAEFFPSRNRIISGLALGVLVVEAAKRSGALITARLAAEEHHREVMALPGRVDSPASAGTLGAIRGGWAALVLEPADVLQQLQSALSLIRGAWESYAPAHETRSTVIAAAPPSTLGAATESQNAILSLLAGGPHLPDQLAAQSNLPLAQVMSDITMLQIRGLVRKNGPAIELAAGAVDRIR
jgi:DNA processing protein